MGPRIINIFHYISNKLQILHSLFISGNCSACFGWYHHPSSGAQTTVSTASVICQTVTFTCRYRLCNTASCWIYSGIYLRCTKPWKLNLQRRYLCLQPRIAYKTSDCATSKLSEDSFRIEVSSGVTSTMSMIRTDEVSKQDCKTIHSTEIFDIRTWRFQRWDRVSAYFQVSVLSLF